MQSRKQVWFQSVVAASACGLMLLGGSCGALHADDEKPAPLNVGGVDQPGGTIKGVVKFAGDERPRKPIATDADPYCTKAHASSPALVETYVFGKDHTLQNVLVYVSKGLEGKTFALPTNSPHIDQVGCVYVPHVRAIVAGQDLLIKNSDATLHNVKIVSANNGTFNKGMAVQGMQIKQKFSNPEMAIPVKCDVHAWMSAYLFVMPNPFFAITQDDGTFEIHGLPPGEYELSFWHELPVFQPDKEHVTITVKGNESQDVTVTYAPKKK